MLRGFLKLGVNIGLFFGAIFVVHFVITGESGSSAMVSVFRQEAVTGNWDLTTTLGRELASREKPISPYVVKKCGEVTHTDGGTMTICIVEFNGTSGGFYDSGKSLMVVGSFDESTLVHEIFHAASIYNYKQGYTDMLSATTQEKMAYDAENLLMQIRAFQEDLTITPDLSNQKKLQLGLPTSVSKTQKSSIK